MPNKMPVKADVRSMTNVPADKLIAIYQKLQNAQTHRDWAAITDIGYELNAIIDSYTTSALPFALSVSSAVCPYLTDGILHDQNGFDIRCAEGFSISAARHPASRCTPECEAKHKCSPRTGSIRMMNGAFYSGNDESNAKLFEIEE